MGRGLEHRRYQLARAKARAALRLARLLAKSPADLAALTRNSGRVELHRGRAYCALAAWVRQASSGSVGAAVGKRAVTPALCSCWKPGRDRRHGEPRCETRRPVVPPSGGCRPPVRLPTADARWRTATVLALCASIDRTGQSDTFGVLADALQDADCDRAEVLDHLRGPVAHDRGCWVVDWLLGRESPEA